MGETDYFRIINSFQLAMKASARRSTQNKVKSMQRPGTEAIRTQIQPSKPKTDLNQLTVMCTTPGERRLIGFRCQKECMECKLAISCRMMHTLIKIHHTVKSYEQFHWLTMGDEQMDGRTHTALCAHLAVPAIIPCEQGS